MILMIPAGIKRQRGVRVDRQRQAVMVCSIEKETKDCMAGPKGVRHAREGPATILHWHDRAVLIKVKVIFRDVV
jgi:hypothetical protein